MWAGRRAEGCEEVGGGLSCRSLWGGERNTDVGGWCLCWGGVGCQHGLARGERERERVCSCVRLRVTVLQPLGTA